MEQPPWRATTRQNVSTTTTRRDDVKASLKYGLPLARQKRRQAKSRRRENKVPPPSQQIVPPLQPPTPTSPADPDNNGITGEEVEDIAKNWPREKHRVETLLASNAFDHDNTRDPQDGGTLAFYAATHNKPDLLRILRDSQAANLTLPTLQYGRTPLMAACHVVDHPCQEGHVECVTILLNVYTSQELQMTDKFDMNALGFTHWNSHHPQCAKIVLDALNRDEAFRLRPITGDDLDDVSKHWPRDQTRLVHLLDKRKFHHDQTLHPKYRTTLANYAAEHNKPDLLRLLKGRPGVNLAFTRGFGTPLMTAVYHGHVESARLLAKCYKAKSLRFEDYHGKTALTTALQNIEYGEDSAKECADIVRKALRRHRKDWLRPISSGNEARLIARDWPEDKERLQHLIRTRQFCHNGLTDLSCGSTMTHWAVHFCKYSLLRLLARTPGVHLALRNSQGHTPLISSRCSKCTQLLAAAYTKKQLLHKAPRYGTTALSQAKERNWPHVTRIIEEAINWPGWHRFRKRTGPFGKQFQSECRRVLVADITDQIFAFAS